MDLIKLRTEDPVRRHVDKDVDDEEMSPLEPPDALNPPGAGQSVAYEQMHPYLQEFRDEHKLCIAELEAVETALTQVQQHGPNQEAHQVFAHFFEFLETDLLPHNRREESGLFPLLARRLLESGEHSQGNEPTTGVDVLEADHMMFIQLSAAMFSLFGVSGYLNDQPSQRIVIEQGIQQGVALVEKLRLHIFREDEVIFSLAQNRISSEEFDRMPRKSK